MNRSMANKVVFAVVLLGLAVSAAQSLYGQVRTSSTSSRGSTSWGRVQPPPINPDPRTQYLP